MKRVNLGFLWNSVRGRAPCQPRRLIAAAIAGTAERFDVFARVGRREFAGGALLRTPAHVLGMLYYSVRERL